MEKLRHDGARETFGALAIQFGEGNFLRGFVEEIVDRINGTEGEKLGIVVVKPRPGGDLGAFARQGNRYTVWLRDGDGEERRVIRCIDQVISAYDGFDQLMALARDERVKYLFSNTTEAGIRLEEDDDPANRPAHSFPAKLTQFLFRRWQYFNGSPQRGLAVLPTELVEDNGALLLRCVLETAAKWGLDPAFSAWLRDANLFCDTLVDRIVTGFPQNPREAFRELGYEDELLVTGERFGLWVIGEPAVSGGGEPPHPAAGLLARLAPAGGVVLTDNLAAYRQRKVRVLNGAHTAFALAAFLCGRDTVGEAMESPVLYRFVTQAVFEEILPCLGLPMTTEELCGYARDVFSRFMNPYIHHRLLDISLNSVSKFRVRVLPSVLDVYNQRGEIPRRLVLSFAALLRFYRGRLENGVFTGSRDGEAYPIRDVEEVTAFFAGVSWEAKDAVEKICANDDLWGMDLNVLPGFAQMAAQALASMEANGVEQTLSEMSGG